MERPPLFSSSATGLAADQAYLTELVRDVIAMMQSGNIARLDLAYGDLRLSVKAHPPGRGAVRGLTDMSSLTRQGDTRQDGSHDPLEHVVTAPMIGTFYASPAPGEPAYVEPGDHVEEGQTIGIIEAMKIMNEIAADRAGTVREVVATNGQTVEYGSALIRLTIDAG